MWGITKHSRSAWGREKEESPVGEKWIGSGKKVNTLTKGGWTKNENGPIRTRPAKEKVQSTGRLTNKKKK